jgi:hypothetical protein
LRAGGGTSRLAALDRFGFSSFRQAMLMTPHPSRQNEPKPTRAHISTVDT